ncbi:MAG: type II toxin-antitoxin system HigB family toxin [Gammaproteobacteria bacterium]|nr:type II toxin-antitoxin system HigB family toxin [Gammaproteobacteria bacterium]
MSCLSLSDPPSWVAASRASTTGRLYLGKWARSEVKGRYRHASFVGDNRVIFNISGNKYRLIVHVNYGFGIVYIKFIGTHTDYDRIDPETI